MYFLAEVFPKLRNIKIPLTRDQLLLLIVALNQIILGGDILLAHSMSGEITPYEWIPIIFGPAAGILLIFAGVIALHTRPTAVVSGMVIFTASILVGVLGTYYHLERALVLSAPLAEMVQFDIFAWAPPAFGPISFIGLGIFGFIISLTEAPTDSGALRVVGKIKLKLPFSKTSIYFFLIGLGILVTVLSSVIDHARTGFTNPWLWFPTLIGVFATVVSLVAGFLGENAHSEIKTYIAAMVLMILAGMIGAYLHLQVDLTSNFVIIQERFLRGAPIMAPLNFANMGLIALIILLDPKEEKQSE